MQETDEQIEELQKSEAPQVAPAGRTALRPMADTDFEGMNNLPQPTPLIIYSLTISAPAPLLPTSPNPALVSADLVTNSTAINKPSKMKYTDDLLVALIKAMFLHHVGDPTPAPKREKMNLEQRWERIANEAPFSAFLQSGALSSWRALYGKGRTLLNDYGAAMRAEKYHTGGGSPKRPAWWSQCEKELDTLHTVCLLA